jgi:hypothetical protein
MIMRIIVASFLLMASVQSHAAEYTSAKTLLLQAIDVFQKCPENREAILAEANVSAANVRPAGPAEAKTKGL